MSDRKNYNSLVFLTTLSVYLGLVLVGGSAPTVLAQAATTRDFNIKNEIVVEDDLDKKPDELSEELEIVKNFRLAEAVTSFVEDLRKLKSIGKIDFAEDFPFSHKIRLETFGESGYHIYDGKTIANPWLQTAIAQLVSHSRPKNAETIADFFPDCDKKDCRQTGTEVDLNSKEFSVSFSFTKTSPETAKLYAEEFNKVFVSQKLAQKKRAALPVYENTKAVSENNQVFIVTRLPRAAIDELLAEK